MNSGDYLIDTDGEKTPYRVEELLATGDVHQVVRAHDDREDRDVALRAILYGEQPDEEHIAYLRAGFRARWEFLEAVADTDLVSEPVEWLEVETSPVDEPPEPLIVCELVEGPTLYDWVVGEHEEGLAPRRALAMADRIAAFVGQAHDAGWLWRDFDPRRFVLQQNQTLRAVSLSAVLPRTGVDVTAAGINADYTAPEVRGESAEELRRPAADLYGLGALLSFLLTGEEPRHRVESPLSYQAHERIRQLDEPGLELLIARLLQPMADRRLNTAGQLRQFCSVDDLPDRQTSGFEDCELPAPWEGLDIDNPRANRGLQSNISAGPLVSMPRQQEHQRQRQHQREGTGDLDWKVIVAVVVVTLLLVVAAILVS